MIYSNTQRNNIKAKYEGEGKEERDQFLSRRFREIPFNLHGAIGYGGDSRMFIGINDSLPNIQSSVEAFHAE